MKKILAIFICSALLFMPISSKLLSTGVWSILHINPFSNANVDDIVIIQRFSRDIKRNYNLSTHMMVRIHKMPSIQLQEVYVEELLEINNGEAPEQVRSIQGLYTPDIKLIRVSVPSYITLKHEYMHHIMHRTLYNSNNLPKYKWFYEGLPTYVAQDRKPPNKTQLLAFLCWNTTNIEEFLYSEQTTQNSYDTGLFLLRILEVYDTNNYIQEIIEAYRHNDALKLEQLQQAIVSIWKYEKSKCGYQSTSDSIYR
jgi:hypothetical protein